MASFLKSELTLDDLNFLSQEAREYALINGLIKRFGGAVDATTFTPFCLFPYPFPEEWFSNAKNVQTYLNLLLYRVSRDNDFLKRTLKETCEVDDFTRRLMGLHEAVLREGYAQTLSLGLFRMDYLLHQIDDSLCLKQVEMNTIAAGSGGSSSALHSLQKHVLRLVDAPDINFPDPKCTKKLSDGLVGAWKAYGVNNSVIVFIVRNEEEGFCDQRRVEYAIYVCEPGLKVFRCTFSMMHEKGSLRNRTLFLDDREVAVVYYRNAYAPVQYPSEMEWSVRLMLERSRAIKCPSITLQLAGTKKVQQELARNGIIEKFLSDSPKDVIRLIRELFAGQFPLNEDEEGNAAVEKALANPEKYVLKPQREGGGNNVFGKDIPEFLNKLQRKERSAYILMDKLKPPGFPGYVIRAGKPVELVSLAAELGIYGGILGDNEKVLKNFEAGHVLRCKPPEENEGGISLGIGSLSLPFFL